MFGYFQPYRNRKFNNFRGRYKNSYCGLCNSLKYNYGQKARLLLSYDVALLDLLLNEHRQKCGCNSCKNGQHIKDAREWKIMAALNLLLFELKLKDDVLDENSLLAKLLLRFYRKERTKARNEFPELATIIEQGNRKIIANEKVDADAIIVAESFASLMLDITDEINPDTEYKSIIKGVSMWLYIIDAIDDYLKDLKSGDFNPFQNNAKKHKTFSEYLFANFNSTTEIFRKIYGCFSPINGRNDINILLYEYIPATTFHILKGNKMPIAYPFNKFKKNRQIETLAREQFKVFVDENCTDALMSEAMKLVEQSDMPDVILIQNFKENTSIEWSVDDACTHFDEWLTNSKAEDIEMFSDIVQLIYNGIPRNCNYSSCLGKCVHITADRQVTFCPMTQSGIAFNGQNITEIFETEEFVHLLEKTITRRDECKKQCVAFNVCGGGCPLKEKSKSDCDFRIKLYLHIKEKIAKGQIQTYNRFVRDAIFYAVAIGV
jgi:radical SAM protein with 4Fe4S-binding SPASM domain